MSPIIAGAMVGAGEVGATWQKAIHAEDLEKLRSENQLEREKTLENLRSKNAQEMETKVRQPFQTQERVAGQEFAAGEHGLNRALTREEGTATRSHQSAEGSATRALQVQLADIHEKGADRRAAQSAGIQLAQLKAMQDQVTLVPAADGTIQKVSRDGRPMGVVSDQTGNAIMGPKDISASTKMLIDGNNIIIKALASDLDKAVTPEDKRSLQDQMARLQQDNRQLAGMGGGAGSAPRSGDRPPLDSFTRGGTPPASGAPAAPAQPRGGYANTLDEVSPPRPKRGIIEMATEDQMMYP